MNRKKIAYIINADWYFKLHWMNRALNQMLEGYDVSLITNFSSEDSLEYFERLGFRCFSWNINRRGCFVYDALSLYSLYKIMKKVDAEIYHSITVKPNVLAGLLSIFFRKILIKSITGTGFIFVSDKFKYAILRRVILSLYKFIDTFGKGCFVFENSSDLRLFSDNRIGKKQNLVHIAGAGVSLQEFYPENEIFSTTHSKIRVLFAARLLKSKGLDTVVSALTDILIKNDFELYVAGISDDGSNDNYQMLELDQLLSHENIKYLGQCDNMPKLINDVDIVVLPTRYGEGIPRVLIESGACKRLVITTNVSGCNELIKNKINGLLINMGDHQQLRDLFKDISDNCSKYKPLASSLYHDVINNYSDEVVIKKFSHLYSSF